MVNNLYLDACIFVAYVHKKHPNHSVVKNCIKALERYEVHVFSSDWAMVEMSKVLKNEYNYTKKQVEDISNKFTEHFRIGNTSITFIDLDNIEQFNFKDFLLYLRNQFLDVKELHLADAIHSTIMSYYNINNILTTDKHFSVLKEIVCIHPRVFQVMVPKDR